MNESDYLLLDKPFAGFTEDNFLKNYEKNALQ